jgi:2-keto-4-pentenoate hydratase/2-oxohepta-3-ene-1,7-dioic acid hydratase in catechol pathway
MCQVLDGKAGRRKDTTKDTIKDTTMYKLVTYQSPRGPRAGLVLDDVVLDVAEATGQAGFATMLDLLRDWDAARGVLAQAAGADRSAGFALSRTKLLPPVPNPGGIFCAGANFTDHMMEMAKVQNLAPEPDPHSVGLKPWHFIKALHCLAAPDSTVTLPAYSRMVDWEAELTAVIGRPARNVSIEQALEHVAGYTIANDLSARDFTKRPHIADNSPFKYDWLSQKCFEDACPLGPWMVPAEAVPNPQNIAIKLWVNDVIKQDSHTSKMIFTLAEQIAHLSTRLTLRPGDLILTGTPAGVGLARKEFLKPGDVVKVWVEGVGTLTNTCA